MGHASGGTPRCSQKNDLKILIEETKKKLDVNNKCWPCPFCFTQEKTELRCLMHVKKEHPNIANSNMKKFLPQNEECTNPKEKNRKLDDLTEFLKLINNDDMNSEQSNTEMQEEPKVMSFENILCGDDDYFYCPHCDGFSFHQRC